MDLAYNIVVDAREKNEMGLRALRIIAPFVLAWVPMIIWRIGSLSGMMISFTFLTAFYAIAAFNRRPFHWRVLVGLLLSSAVTFVILCVGAASAERDFPSSLREIDTAYQWVFFANVCLYCLALVAPIWAKRRRLRRQRQK